MKWEYKIQAFLYPYPLDFAINPGDQEERARNYLKILGLDQNIPDWLQDAHNMAFGVDVPAFVRKKEFKSFLENPFLTHPLSGAREKISRQIDHHAAEQAIQKALKEVKGYIGNTPSQETYKKAFLVLWRLLPQLIQEKEASNPKLGPLWEVMPAHPAIPDHSIWDHASTASALAGTYNRQVNEFQPALLIFTLASPQDFLAAARRTQDLWMGSFLYSFLIWQAIKPIADKLGPDALIYPSLYGQPLVDRWLLYEVGIQHQDIEKNATDIERLKIANFPNLFTAIVPEPEAENLAKRAKDTLLDTKKSIMEEAQGYVEDLLHQSFGPQIDIDNNWKNIWSRQIEKFLDFHIFWVIYPWRASNGGKSLGDIKKDYKHLLGAPHEALIKFYEAILKADPKEEANLGLCYPLFSSLAGRLLASRKNLRHFMLVAEPGHKCTQCGIREALHPSFEDKDIYPKLREFWDELRTLQHGEKKLLGRIRRGDRLCAICLGKRLAWEAFFLRKRREEGGFEDVHKKLKDEERLPAHLLFPSTATIATAKFKERVLKELQNNPESDLWCPLEKFVKTMQNTLDHYFYPSAAISKLEKLAQTIFNADQEKEKILNGFLRLDGDWLYSESLNPEVFQREYGEPKGNLEEARRALEDFLKAAEKVGIPEPQHYFALLAMDADNIGKWLSGEKAPKLGEIIHPDLAGGLEEYGELLSLQRPLGPTHHRSLSASLKNFALEIVRSIVEEKYCGRLIYAGGDDVLAFLPIEDLLGAMNDLRNAFTGQAKEIDLGDGRIVVFDGWARIKNGEEEEHLLLLPAGMTLSAGAVIAHETHPFYHVVEEGRAALREAKDRYGRDAWAIYVLKRSGEPIRTGAKWKYGELKVLDRLEKVAELFETGLSPRFLYEMARISPGMRELEPKAMEVEMQRLLQRREGLSPEDHATLQKLEIPKWFDLIDPIPEGKTKWDVVLEWLRLAYFIARGARR